MFFYKIYIIYGVVIGALICNKLWVKWCSFPNKNILQIWLVLDFVRKTKVVSFFIGGRQYFNELLYAVILNSQNTDDLRWKNIIFINKVKRKPYFKIFLWENEHRTPLFYYILVFLVLFHINYIFYRKKIIFMMLLYDEKLGLSHKDNSQNVSTFFSDRNKTNTQLDIY